MDEDKSAEHEDWEYNPMETLERFLMITAAVAALTGIYQFMGWS